MRAARGGHTHTMEYLLKVGAEVDTETLRVSWNVVRCAVL